MKIFVTGATGFIGKHLVNNLLKSGHQIIINLFGDEISPFDDKVMTWKLNEQESQQDIQFFRNQNISGIIHLASLYLTTHKPEDAVRLIDSNVRFSTYVLECAVQAEIKWFLNTGTFWQHFQQKDYSPVNLYAASKQAFESIARYYAEMNLIQFNTLKLSDTFGPNDTRPKIFNLWDRISTTGEKFEMSPGDQLIDISYIEDIILAFCRLAALMDAGDEHVLNGDCFAVRASQQYSLKELASIYESATGKKLNIVWGGKPYRDREVMNPWLHGKTVPGWEPQYTLQNAIRKTFNLKEENES